MPQVDRWEQGSFCWAELSTSDAEGAKAFYTGLFGWEVDAREIPGGVYNLFRANGKGVGACFEPPEGAPSGPPNWNQYIAVDDVDAKTKAAEEAGSTIMMAPFDVMEYGRMSFLTDPTGAALGLWQFGQERSGWELYGEVNAPSWNELMVPDTSKAQAFYEQVFGWTGDTQDWGPGPYTTFKVGEKQVAGLFATPPDAAGTPPMWTQYFSVADAKATVEKAKELGGQTILTRTLEKVGTFAGFTDPQGAMFSIIEPEPPAS
ncbi:MAG: VOC family protein [Actinomycetota bacterium]